MNARLAIQENETLVAQLLASAKEMAQRLNISVEKAIEKRVAFYVKYAKTSTESAAWEIRGREAIKIAS